MIQNISILGSTGSIGTQALDVVDNLNLQVSALTANTNIDILEEQVRKYKPALAVIYDENKYAEFKTSAHYLFKGYIIYTVLSNFYSKWSTISKGKIFKSSFICTFTYTINTNILYCG